MHRIGTSRLITIASLISAAIIVCATPTFAQHEQAFPFTFADGSQPQGGLISDALGNLYGTTAYGGSGICKDNHSNNVGCGTVFEMSPPVPPNTRWTHTVLYNFDEGSDGIAQPIGTLVFDPTGNLYGVSANGGNFTAGTAFELSPPLQSGGNWTLTFLVSFEGGTGPPQGGLVIDQSGNFYGTALGDGTCGFVSCGLVYELSQSQGQWFEMPLYSFRGQEDGAEPVGSLVLDAAGNLYGTTTGTTQFGQGTIFKLSASSQIGQQWTETTLHTFGATPGDGTKPLAGVTFGPKGTLVGTTSSGGTFQEGTVFGLAPPSSPGAQWGYKTLYSFGAMLGDGIGPGSSLTLQTSKTGTVAYGTTTFGGMFKSGTVFQLTQSGLGMWSETPVYNFTGGKGGDAPTSALLLENYALYGTTFGGGVNNAECPVGCGTVFRLSR